MVLENTSKIQDSLHTLRQSGEALSHVLQTPDFAVIINGNDSFLKERVVSIHTTDEAGIMSDSCEIEFDDFDDALQFPKTEAKIEVSLGHKDSGLTKIGSYYVKEIAIDGNRKIVKISASAVSKKMRSQTSKSHDQTAGDFLSELAGEFGMDSAISDEFSDMDLEDFPQFAESNMNYLTGLSQRVGAVSKPADGHLIFAENMTGKSASGKTLETKYIDISEVSSYSYSFKETEEGNGGVGTIFANWYDKNAAEYHMVSSGSGDLEYELDEIFSSEKEALTAANAKFKRVVKANKRFEFSTIGRPDFFAEHPIIITGFSTKIPTNWIISRVEHTLSSNGFSTHVECSNLLA